MMADSKQTDSRKTVEEEDEDDDDIGLDVSLFGEERVNHGGPGNAPVIWTCPGRSDLGPIKLKVSKSSSTLLMAHHVWQSSMTLSEILARRELEHARVRIGPDSSVVELGAGAALPSIVCDRALSAKHVVATDYPDPNVVEAMRVNARVNACSDRLMVMGYDWAADHHEVLKTVGGHVDYVLAADTLWIAKYHEIHLKAVLALMSDSSKLVLAFMHHDHDGSTAEHFLKFLLNAGLVCVHEETRDWRTGSKSSETRSKLEYGDVIIKVFKRQSDLM